MTDSQAIHCFERSGLGKAPFHFVSYRKAVFQACPGAPIQAGATCDYCGTCIMHVYEIESSDNRRFIVGCDCVARTGDAGLIKTVKAHRTAVAKSVRDARREARKAGQKKLWENAAVLRRKARRAQAGEFAKAHGLIPAFRKAGKTSDLARKLLRDLRSYGFLSARTVDLIKDLAITLKPAPSGRVTLTGVVKSVKVKYSPEFGSVLKMTVLADDGFKVWTTVPRSMCEAVYSEAPGAAVVDTLRGRRVSLKVTLTPSDNDPGFAFGNRPTGKVLP